MKRTIDGYQFTRYGVMFSEVEQIDPLHLRPLGDIRHPWLQPTVSSVTAWIEETFPDLVLTFPATNGHLLSDAVRAMSLYGFLRVDLKDPTTGKRYEARFVEI